MITLGARDFSSVVSGFCQVFIVSRFAARGFDLRQTPKIPAAREKNLSYRCYQMMGIELNCTPGKRWGGGPGGRERIPSLPFSNSPLSFFLREFFFGALLSERLQQVTRGSEWNAREDAVD